MLNDIIFALKKFIYKRDMLRIIVFIIPFSRDEGKLFWVGVMRIQGIVCLQDPACYMRAGIFASRQGNMLAAGKYISVIARVRWPRVRMLESRN